MKRRKRVSHNTIPDSIMELYQNSALPKLGGHSSKVHLCWSCDRTIFYRIVSAMQYYYKIWHSTIGWNSLSMIHNMNSCDSWFMIHCTFCLIWFIIVVHIMHIVQYCTVYTVLYHCHDAEFCANNKRTWSTKRRMIWQRYGTILYKNSCLVYCTGVYCIVLYWL